MYGTFLEFLFRNMRMFHEKIMKTRIQNASLEKFQSIATSKLHIETPRGHPRISDLSFS